MHQTHRARGSRDCRPGAGRIHELTLTCRGPARPGDNEQRPGAAAAARQNRGLLHPLRVRIPATTVRDRLHDKPPEMGDGKSQYPVELYLYVVGYITRAAFRNEQGMSA